MNAAGRLSSLLSYTTQDHVRKVDTIYSKLGPTTFKKKCPICLPTCQSGKGTQICTPLCYVALLLIAKIQRQSKCPLADNFKTDWKEKHPLDKSNSIKKTFFYIVISVLIWFRQTCVYLLALMLFNYTWRIREACSYFHVSFLTTEIHLCHCKK